MKTIYLLILLLLIVSTGCKKDALVEPEKPPEVKQLKKFEHKLVIEDKMRPQPIVLF